MKTTTTTETKNWRVLRINKQMLEEVRAVRDSRKTTTTNLLATAVAEQLPQIMAFLESIGIRKDAGERQVVRWSLADETLDSLRHASEQTGLPSVALLKAALTLATGCKAQNKPAAKTQKKATRKAGKRGAK